MNTTTVRSPAATMPAAVALLDQCRVFLDAIDDASYTTKSSTMFGATIGQHVRHSLDHFSAALNAIEDEPIAYDHRDRDTDVEKQREVAIRTIDVLKELIHAAPGSQADRPVTVRIMLSGDGDEAELTSTFGRELAFATHHGVHHHAMIGVIATELGLELPAGFGKAPSTVQYEKSGKG